MGSTVLWLGACVILICVLGALALIGLHPAFAVLGATILTLLLLLLLALCRGRKK